MKSMSHSLSTALLGLCLVSAAQAGTFVDNFNTSRDYKTQGVAGSQWSGITPGIITPSLVTNWNANITAANTLTLTNAGGNWRAANDGPFLWTRVTGDFTNVVHVSDMSQANYHMAGLMVRNPDTSLGQNYIMLAQFAEFNLGVIYRDTVNNSDSDVNYTPPYHVETNKLTWASWLQVTRVGGVISLSISTNGASDTWEPVYTSARTDLAGEVQVGIMDSTYTANQAWAQFQNFSIVGPEVNTATPPARATALSVTPAPNSLNVTWANGAGSAGSVVVFRQGPILQQPVNGSNYVANAVFGSGDDLGQSNYVAYVGSGTSVTLTGVTPTIPYTVAVYSYSGSMVYAISNAPVATAAPQGNPIGIAVTYGTTNAVATDDTIQVAVKLLFDTGGSIDVTAGSTFSSAGSSVASVSTSGLASGLTAGVAAITANYSTYSVATNLTVIKLPVTDDFSTARDFLTASIVGTFWSGLMIETNDVPYGGNVSSTNFTTLYANANITKPGRLAVSTHDGGFGVGSDTGFFLYKVISGDFSIAIQIPRFDSDNGTNAFHMPGLMIRAPFDLAFTESFLQWHSFNEYGIGNFSRRSINGAFAETYFQPMPAQPYLMIQRETNTFKFYQKAHGLDAWTLVGSEDRPEYDGVAMQVGIVDQTFTGNTASTEFDNLIFSAASGITNSINAPASATGLNLTSSSLGKATATWTAGAGSSGSVVIAHPVTINTRQPVDSTTDYSGTANADFTLGENLGASNIVVYAGTGTSVPVVNLPFSQSYFTVYSYKNVGGTNYYNLVNPATGSINAGPISISIVKTPGGVQVTWPQGTLLEASSVTGPWTTNLATSPLVIPNPTGTKFYRVQMQ